MRVRLFGSRVDDHRKGGDIDLLIEGVERDLDPFLCKLRFLADLKSEIGEQRIDVVVRRRGDVRQVVKEARAGGVAL